MKKTLTSHQRELLRGLLVCVIGFALIAAAKIWLFPVLFPQHTSIPAATPATTDEVNRFEAHRREDSLLKAQIRAEQWENKRQAWESRRRANELREQEYQKQRAQWEAEKQQRAIEKARRQARYDSLRRQWPQKLSAGEMININTADTSQLQRIPGIGAAYARAIIHYRERLGGFVSMQQLHEIHGLPAGIETWIRLPTGQALRRININRATFKELLSHPYLNYQQVKAIVNRRNKTGVLRDWQDLAGNPFFGEHDFIRLAPYFSF